MTRAEHLAWAKHRALEYLERGENVEAIGSMISDLGKHPELERHIGVMIAPYWAHENTDQVRHWIEGFN